MTSAGPWSVKGIDPKARELAKDLARRSGMTLGEWLNQMITDGGDEPPPPEPEPMRRAQLGTRPFAGQDHPARRAFDRLEEIDASELARVTRALDGLSQRLEAAEQRSTLAITGIDQSVMGVLARLDGAERDQSAIGARIDGHLDEVRAAQAKLADRMRRMEQEDGPRVEAMKALEQALSRVATQIYEGESRSRAGLSEVRQDLSGISRRVDNIDARLEARTDAGTTAGHAELQAALARMSERLERAEAAAPAAISRLAERLEHAEAAAPAAISRLAERLERAEAAAPAAADLQGAIAHLAERLEKAEGRTSAAVAALESSFASLDHRLGRAEQRMAPATGEDSPERRFERLAADLADKVEASRAEMAERLRAAADGKLDRMEAALRDLTSHVETAEKQSAKAIDRMGQEVVKIAQSLGQRVQTVETRSAQAVEQVGGEMARIADAMENRMRAADTVQAEALEKLGGEIARIAERLAERISSSERRSAQAIEDVGDQVSRVTEKLNQRQERASTELSERIRQSEERTAKLLQEAQEKVDRRLLDTQRRHAIEAAAPPVEPPHAHPRAPEAVPTAFDAPSFVSPVFKAEPAISDDPFGAPEPIATTAAFDPPPEPAAFVPPEPAMPPRADESFAPEAFAPSSFAPPPLADDDFDPYLPEPPQPQRTSTRELIEAARAAARQAAATDGRTRRGRTESSLPPLPGAAPAPPADETPLRGLSALLGRRKKKEASATLKTVLVASVTAVGLSTAAVGVMLMSQGDGGAAPREAEALPQTASASGVLSEDNTAAEVLASAIAPEPVATAAAADAAAPPARPLLGSTRDTQAPVLAGAATPASDTKATAGPSPQQLYSVAVRQLESGDATGLEPLRRAANLGLPVAQFYLAKLYESGSSGLKKDPLEARRWTERAAQGGDSKAMHNLGLYYFEGVGGAKNPIIAATWFRRAAEAGLQDSQYNLARLYEQGYGVARNAPEAYKWYLIAAQGGDAEAKASADRMRATLSQDSQLAAQRSASAFRAVRTAAN